MLTNLEDIRIEASDGKNKPCVHLQFSALYNLFVLKSLIEKHQLCCVSSNSNFDFQMKYHSLCSALNVSISREKLSLLLGPIEVGFSGFNFF